MINKYIGINIGNGNNKILAIDFGYKYTCAVFTDYAVKCFESGQFGKLGSGSSTIECNYNKNCKWKKNQYITMPN